MANLYCWGQKFGLYNPLIKWKGSRSEYLKDNSNFKLLNYLK